MGNKKKAVIQTLVYSSLFDSALTFDELFYFLQDGSMNAQSLSRTIQSLRYVIVQENNFYTLKEYKNALKLRQKRIVISQAKKKQAKHIARILSLFPTVLFIGISGSVAVENAEDNDDIDLFIITKKNSIYITRFFLLIFLQALGRRRKRNEHKERNKICLNMFIDESNMSLEPTTHNLYTAREIAQIYPLFERDHTYQKFLQANSWTQELLPHALGRTEELLQGRIWPIQVFVWLEPIFRHLEQLFMSRHKTREQIEDHLLALHPEDVKNRVLQGVAKRISQYEKYYK